MAGVLLDTNALIWLLAGDPLDEAALFVVAQAQADGMLFVSPISAWKPRLRCKSAIRCARGCAGPGDLQQRRSRRLLSDRDRAGPVAVTGHAGRGNPRSRGETPGLSQRHPLLSFRDHSSPIRILRQAQDERVTLRPCVARQ